MSYSSGFAAASLAPCLLSPPANAASRVERSNDYSNLVLEELAKYSPEGAGRLGVDRLDAAIIDLEPGIHGRALQSSQRLLALLRGKLDVEKDRRVRQDLEILIRAVEDNIATAELERDDMLPYFNLNETIFGGVRALIDPQVERGAAGLHGMHARRPIGTCTRIAAVERRSPDCGTYSFMPLSGYGKRPAGSRSFTCALSAASQTA